MSVTIHPPAGFQGLRPDKPIRIYKRNLPHWRQDGAAYFVTFRQQDSIPPAVWQAMQEELQYWRRRADEEELRHGGELPDRFLKEWDDVQRRHLVKVESELDACQGSCLFAVPENRTLVSESLRFFDHQRHELHGYVIMPNHVHLAVTPHAAWDLEALLQSWKGFTAREVNKRMGRTGTLWQGESYDRIIRDGAHFEKMVRYIMNNPAKARLGWVAEGIVREDSDSTLGEGAAEYGDEADVW